MADLIIRLSGHGLGDEDIAELSHELVQDLNAEVGTAKIGRAAPAPGERGGEIAFGTILLAALSSGAVTALIELVRARIGRDKRIKFDLERADGQILRLDAQNMTPEEIESALSKVAGLAAD